MKASGRTCSEAVRFRLFHVVFKYGVLFLRFWQTPVSEIFDFKFAAVVRVRGESPPGGKGFAVEVDGFRRVPEVVFPAAYFLAVDVPHDFVACPFQSGHQIAVDPGHSGGVGHMVAHLEAFGLDDEVARGIIGERHGGGAVVAAADFENVDFLLFDGVLYVEPEGARKGRLHGFALDFKETVEHLFAALHGSRCESVIPFGSVLHLFAFSAEDEFPVFHPYILAPEE